MPCRMCGFKDERCTCSQIPEFGDLGYTNADYEVPDSFIRQLLAYGRRDNSNLSTWKNHVCGSAKTDTNVRKGGLFAVGSVRTITRIIDEATDSVRLNDIGTIKEVFEETTDGQKKWDVFHTWYTSDLPQKACEHAKNGDWLEAIASLSGLQKGFNGRDHESYLRVTKANLIAEIIGDPDALCLDSGRRRALEPMFEEMFTGEKVHGTHMSRSGDYRGQAVDADKDAVRPRSKRFLEDWLTLNPEEYRSITKEILDRLEAETGMDRREISHALFLIGTDADTGHEPLAEMLD